MDEWELTDTNPTPTITYLKLGNSSDLFGCFYAQGQCLAALYLRVLRNPLR